jgi:hypothetical protein
VAAIENYKERAIRCKPSDDVLVQHVAIDLAFFLEIDGADGVQDAGRVLTRRVLDLSSVPGVVEEVGGTRFTYQPVKGGLGWLVKGRKGRNVDAYRAAVRTRILCPVG